MPVEFINTKKIEILRGKKLRIFLACYHLATHGFPKNLQPIWFSRIANILFERRARGQNRGVHILIYIYY